MTNRFLFLRQSRRSLEQENAPLVAAIQQAQADPENLSGLYRLLREARLIMPLAAPLPPRRRTESSMADVRCLLVERQETRGLIGGTSVTALKRIDSLRSAPTVTLSARELFRMASEGSLAFVLIYFGGAEGFLVPRDAVQSLAAGDLPVTTASEEPIPDVPLRLAAITAIPVPDALPPALRSRLRDAGTTEAYWFWAMRETGKPELGLAVTPPTPEQAAQVRETLTALMTPDSPPFFVVPLDERPLAQIIRKSCTRLL